MSCPATCPICSQPNGCKLYGKGPAETRDAPCWCRDRTFPPELIARAYTFPSCVCVSCLNDSVSPRDKQPL